MSPKKGAIQTKDGHRLVRKTDIAQLSLVRIERDNPPFTCQQFLDVITGVELANQLTRRSECPCVDFTVFVNSREGDNHMLLAGTSDMGV